MRSEGVELKAMQQATEKKKGIGKPSKATAVTGVCLHSCVCMCLCMCVPACMRTYMRTCVRACVRGFVHVCM